MPEESGSEKRRQGKRARPSRESKREPKPIVRRSKGEPGPTQLYALLAGAGLTVLGVLGFFYDAGFGTGVQLDGDDVAGLLIVNGWRNVIYLVTGLLALGFAASRPRSVALALGAIYLALGISGAANTSNDIGSLFDALPLTDEDNIFHILIGAIGLIAFLAEGGIKMPSTSKRRPKRPPRKRPAVDRP